MTLSLLTKIDSKRKQLEVPLWYSYEAALNWLIVNHLPGAGIAVSNLEQKSYPEVTGYLIPTLLEAGEKKLALELARWLVSIQMPDGGFADPDGLASHLFDTGQVLRGLLALIEIFPEVESSIRKAADWMLASGDEGIIRPAPSSPWSQRYGHKISENIHLYALPPLLEAGNLLNEPRYIHATEQSLDYFVNKPDVLRFEIITHFYGYVLEALVDLGRTDLAQVGLNKVIDLQSGEGFIPALPGVEWMCSPGSAQMAVVGYKLGSIAFANAAVDYIQSIQMPSGGFLGSYGPGAAYGPDTEPSWACKYFLDACHWRISRSFTIQEDRFAAELSQTDPRFPLVLSGVGDAADKRILDVGCGKGPFLRLLQEHFPSAQLYGVDISPELLKYVPSTVWTKRASMLNLPFPDAHFDIVLCVEALEHAIRMDAAVREMCRVVKPGGQIIIIDKDAKHLGLLPIERWEKWLNPEEVNRSLKRYCSIVSSQYFDISLGDQKRPLFVLWQGTRDESQQVEKESYTPVPSAISNSEILGQYNVARRRAEAGILVREGFQLYKQKDLPGARNAFLKALRLDSSWIKNRGILSIILHSLLGYKTLNLLRMLTGRSHRSSD